LKLFSVCNKSFSLRLSFALTPPASIRVLTQKIFQARRSFQTRTSLTASWNSKAISSLSSRESSHFCNFLISISLFTALFNQEKLKSKLSLSSHTRGKIFFPFSQAFLFSFQS